MALFTRTTKLDPGAHDAVHHAVGTVLVARETVVIGRAG